MRDRVFWVILAVGAGLRLGLAVEYPYMEARGDQLYHYVLSALLPHFGHGVLGHWASIRIGLKSRGDSQRGFAWACSYLLY